MVDFVDRLHALERALTRMGVRVVEEELPEEASIDGGLCKLEEQWVLYVSSRAPPWKKANVLLGALRRLPNDEVWLPPEVRRMLEREDCGDASPRLVGCSYEAKR